MKQLSNRAKIFPNTKKKDKDNRFQYNRFIGKNARTGTQPDTPASLSTIPFQFVFITQSIFPCPFFYPIDSAKI